MYLIHRDLPDTFKDLYRNVPRDVGNCSSAFRLAYFTVRILSSFDVVSKLSIAELETLSYFIPLVVQLIDDDLSIENCNGITGLSHSDQRDEYMEIVHDGRRMISQWARSEVQPSGTKESISSIILSFWQGKLEALGSTSPADYRIGEAFVKLMNSIDVPGRNKSPEEITKLCREMRTANAIKSAAQVAVLRDLILANPAGIRLCNELVADSTGLKPKDEKKDG